MRIQIWAASAVFALVAAVVPAATASDLVPREVFFGNPDRARVTISPDGTAIAYLAEHQGVLNVWVEPLDGGPARPLTASAHRPIRRYFWAENGRQVIYAQDRDGNEDFHLYAVDIDSGETLDLTPMEGIQARVLGTDRDQPDTVLAAINDRVPTAHDAWRIDTRTGEREMVFRNDGGFTRMLPDHALQVRVVTRIRPDGGAESFLRDDVDDPWHLLASWPLADAATSEPLAFSRDGRTLYVIDSRRSNTGRLHAFTAPPGDDDEARYELLAGHERADVYDVIFDPVTGRPQAVAFEYARREWRILDGSIRADWTYLTGVTNGELSLLGRDRADARWVVSYTRDDGPVEYYLYDRPARRATFLFSNRRALRDIELAKMRAVIIPARDGLSLVSYVTVPPGAGGRRPMVLLVHGGPWARDRWGYNPLHQWLANRGYAVLSVNFRGSTGFGKAFINAGNREWSGRMHDDLIDAVNWAVDEGIADPDRVAIMGGSYGGYATLVGLTKTPEFFAAGVDIVGPSDVRTLLESIPPYWEAIRAMFDARVGRLDEPDYLEAISPLSRVDAITRPLLIAQGRNDPRVKEAQSEMIVEAMQAKGLPVTYLLFPDEGHGFARPVNNLAFFAVAESFLATHLGGRAEPIGSEISASSVQVPAGAALIPGLETR